MWKEFKEFAVKGNVLDMAVGIIIGAAFGKIVGSAVEDILMPPLGMLLGGVDFSNLFVSLSSTQYASVEAAKTAGAAVVRYGVFLNTVINFVIVAFAVFLMVKGVNRLRRTQPVAGPPPSPTTKACAFCCSQIPLHAVRCAFCTSDLRSPAAV